MFSASGHQASGGLSYILGFVLTFGTFNDVNDIGILARNDILYLKGLPCHATGEVALVG